MGFINILDFKICTSFDELSNKQHQIVANTINPHSYCVSKNDHIFLKALQNSNILVPDGIGIVWAASFLKSIKINRITGADLHQFLIKKNGARGGKVFYLGSTPKTLKRIETRIKNEYPNIQVASYSPPFKSKFTQEENLVMINAINKFKPDCLFVGMTAPKQEKWVYKFKNDLDVKVISSIGAVFDFYAGNVDRAPQFMISLGLEWLHRSLKSIRLLKRNLISNPMFVIDVIKIKYSIKD